MQYSPIYLLGRTPSKLETLKDDFSSEYDIRIIHSVNDLDTMEKIPTVAIGTIPADQPIDASIREILCALLEKAKSEQVKENAPIGSLPAGGKRILLEMAYKPAVTALIQLAENAGWKTVNGLEVLVGQGVHQFEYWTGITPLFKVARVSQ
jgi:pentafunctional AROM polypeptide